MSEDEIRDLFREMREEPVPADSLARVRLGLSDRIRRRARWKAAAWVVACAVVVLAGFLMRPWVATNKRVDAPVVARGRETPPQELPLFTSRLAVRPAIQRTRRPPRRTSEAVTIRIETPDPEVVILLVGE